MLRWHARCRPTLLGGTEAHAYIRAFVKPKPKPDNDANLRPIIGILSQVCPGAELAGLVEGAAGTCMRIWDGLLMH